MRFSNAGCEPVELPIVEAGYRLRGVYFLIILRTPPYCGVAAEVGVCVAVGFTVGEIVAVGVVGLGVPFAVGDGAD